MKSFKLIAVSAALACCAGLCGCHTSNAGMKYEDGKLTVYDYRFARNLEMKQDVGRRTNEGFLHVQVRVRNKNPDNFHSLYRFVWLDAQGVSLEQAGYVSDKPLVLRGCEEAVLKETANVADAVDFRLEIRPRN